MRKIRDDWRYYRARKRLSKVSASHVLTWADSGLWAVQQALDVHRRENSKAALEEAKTGAIGLLAAIEVMLDK